MKKSQKNIREKQTQAPSLIKEARWYTKKGNRKYIIIAIVAIPSVAFLGSFGSDIYSSIKDTCQEQKKKSYNFEEVKTKIKRFVEDCNLSVEKNASEFPEESARIAHSAAMGGMYSSGPHLKMQWKAAIDYRMKIDEAVRILIRETEDLLLDKFKEKDITKIPELKEEAETIKTTLEYCENAKKKIEDHVREIDLRINKEKPKINDKFEL